MDSRHVGLSSCGTWAHLVVAPMVYSTGSIVMAQGLSCSVACGILPDKGLNPCLLHWRRILYHWATRKAPLILNEVNVVVVQLLSRVWLFATPWTAGLQGSLSLTISWTLLRLRSIESVMLSNHFIPRCPLLLLRSISPSISIFSNESAVCIKWPKYWNFSFSISPSDEYSGFISYKIVWFDLLAVQGTLKSLIQHHSSRASILQCSVFFMVQLSHPYMTSRKKTHNCD